MFKSILVREINRNIRQIPFYLFGCIILALVILYTQNTDPSTVIFGLSHGEEFNVAAIKIAKMMCYWTIAGIFFAMVMTGRSVVRDFQVNIHDFFFTSQLSKSSYLGARFLGSYISGLLLFLFIPLGFVMGNAMLSPALQGVLQWQSFIYPLLFIVIPNLLLISAFLFCISVLTRQTMITYVGSIILIIIYLFGILSLNSLKSDAARILLDPFGQNALNLASQYWTTFEKNANFMPMDSLFIWNRIIWSLVAVCILGWTYKRFKMTHDVSRKGHKSKPLPRIELLNTEAFTKPVISVNRSASARLRAIGAIVTLEWKRILLHPAFLIIGFLGISQIITNFLGSLDVLDGKVYPLTSWYLSQTFNIWMYMVPIVILFGGMIVWREKDHLTHEIYHTFPLSDAQRVIAKLLALMGVQFFYLLGAMIAGILTQLLAFQYSHIELGLYIKRLFLMEFFNYIQLTILVILIQAAVRNKVLGFFISSLFIAGDLIVFGALKWDFLLIRWGHFPSYIYSNLNGFGAYSGLLLAYGVYWLIFSAILVLISILVWKSSENDSLKQRLQHAFRKMNRRMKLVLASLCLLFIMMGSFIAYNRYVLNHYMSAKGYDLAMANYERQCESYKTLAQPSVTAVNLTVDLFPASRSALIKGQYILKNKGSQNIDTLLISLWDNKRADLQKFELSAPHQVIESMRDFRLGIFHLQQPLLPGDSMTVSFVVDYRSKGFTDNHPETAIVQNGTVMDFGGKDTPQFIPQIGINKEMFLQTEFKRKKYKLPSEPILATLEKADRSKGFGNVDDIRYRCQVSTEKGQTAITNGELTRRWDEGNRSYFVYEPAIPITNEIALTSGVYRVKKQTYRNTKVEVYYDAKHVFNIDRIIKGFQASIDLNSGFEVYPHKTLRVVEIPAYSDQFGARAYPMLYIWNETVGFVSRISKNGIDGVFAISAHEMAHHWWGYYLTPADAQGLYLPVESMAQFMEAMSLEKQFGKDAVYKFLATNRKQYLKGRSRATAGEVPLARVQHNQSHICYQKGIIQLYALREYIGKDAMFKALKTFYDTYAHTKTKYPLSTDMIAALSKETPDSLKYLLDDLFMHITLYDLKIDKPRVTLFDGRYQLDFDVQTHKFYADNKGRQTEQAFNDYVFIGLFDKNGKSTYYRMQQITGNKSHLSIVTDNLPYEVGIDPHGLLIDTNMDDNRQRVIGYR